MGQAGAPLSPGPRLDPAHRPRLHSQLFLNFQWHLGVQELGNTTAPATLQASRPSSQLQLFCISDCTSQAPERWPGALLPPTSTRKMVWGKRSQSSLISPSLAMHYDGADMGPITLQWSKAFFLFSTQSQTSVMG